MYCIVKDFAKSHVVDVVVIILHSLPELCWFSFTLFD